MPKLDLVESINLALTQEMAADDRVILGGVKLFLDGSGGARTAWMHDDWSLNFKDTDVGNKGFPTTAPDVYREQVRMIHNAGLHVSTRSINQLF